MISVSIHYSCRNRDDSGRDWKPPDLAPEPHATRIRVQLGCVRLWWDWQDLHCSWVELELRFEPLSYALGDPSRYSNIEFCACLISRFLPLHCYLASWKSFGLKYKYVPLIRASTPPCNISFYVSQVTSGTPIASAKKFPKIVNGPTNPSDRR